MLPNHAPLKVAESFKMLEALHPGRIDLGIGRAPGTDPATAALLRRLAGRPRGRGLPRAPARPDRPRRRPRPHEPGRRNRRRDAPPTRPSRLSTSSAPRTRAPPSPPPSARATPSPPTLATSTRRGPCSPTAPAFQPGLRERPHAILTVQAVVADTEDEARTACHQRSRRLRPPPHRPEGPAPASRRGRRVPIQFPGGGGRRRDARTASSPEPPTRFATASKPSPPERRPTK